MIFHAHEFSDFETCPRLPQIKRIYEPPRWPVRDAVKQFLGRGIRGIFYGSATPAQTRKYFAESAASPGYEYPKNSEAYILANDHADWLEGALEIIKAEHGGAFVMDLMQLQEIGPYKIHIEAWRDRSGDLHIFRAQANLSEGRLSWPEITALGFTGKQVHVHIFRLPSVRDGRLVSPLNMAYKHPHVNVNLRLARLYDEPEFGKGWKKTARWEVTPKIEWPEWQAGIEKDKCIDQIRKTFTISPILDASERDKIIFDVEHMASVMEKPHLWPRFREACQDCVFAKLCHGDEASRSVFRIASPEALDRYEKSYQIRDFILDIALLV